MQIFFEMIHLLWLAGLTVAVVRLWDNNPVQEHKQAESIDDAWQPVELSDEREFEMDEQLKRRQFFKV